MAEVKDMYKIVRFVNNWDVNDMLDEKIQTHENALINLIQTFRGKSRALIFRSKFERVTRATNNAIEDKYLSFRGSKNTGYYIDVTRKGSHLLGKKFYFYRAGLVDDSLKAYGRSQRFYLGILTGGSLAAVISGVITYLLSHH